MWKLFFSLGKHSALYNIVAFSVRTKNSATINIISGTLIAFCDHLTQEMGAS
jgi:hypothetical protein